MSKIFELGERVTVIDDGNTYTSYSEVFKIAGFKNKKSNSGLTNGSIAKVFWRGFHENGRDMLYAIRDTRGIEALVNQKAIKDLDKGVILKRSDIMIAMEKMDICPDWREKLAKNFSDPFVNETLVSTEFIEECYENANEDVKSFMEEIYEDVICKPKLKAIPLVSEPNSDFNAKPFFTPEILVVKKLAGKYGIPKELQGRAIIINQNYELNTLQTEDGRTVIYFTQK